MILDFNPQGLMWTSVSGKPIGTQMTVINKIIYVITIIMFYYTYMIALLSHTDLKALSRSI